LVGVASVGFASLAESFSTIMLTTVALRPRRACP